MSVNLKNSNLFKPIKVGTVELKNRLVLSPSARLRATIDHEPTDLMLQYYTKRAKNNGGLLTVEATGASDHLGAMPYAPGITTDEQATKWKMIVDSVHAEGSAISLQLWAMGRIVDPAYQKANGKKVLGPSKIYNSPQDEKAAIADGNELQEMTIEDIEILKKEFVSSAKRAVEISGMDFVEIHGGNGFILEQFIRDGSNQRTDQYGGSIENRARLILEIVDDLIEAVGASKVGIKLAPYFGNHDIDRNESYTHHITQYSYIYQELEKRAEKGNRIAYVSFVEPVMDLIDTVDSLKDFYPTWMEEIWKGVIIRTGNFTQQLDKLQKSVDSNDRVLIGASRHYTSNPDLAYRLKEGLELTPYDRPTFYVPLSNNGYNTFTKYGEEDLSAESIEAALKAVSL